MFKRNSLFVFVLLFGIVSIAFAQRIIDEDLDTGDDLILGDDQNEAYVEIDPSQGNTINVLDDLEILPETEIRFMGNFSLVVDAGVTLTAEGELGNEILFTTEETNPDLADYWGQIYFEGDADTEEGRAVGEFAHCIFEYGGYTGIAAVEGYAYARISFDNCNFTEIENTADNVFAFGSNGSFSNVCIMADNNTVYDCSNGLSLKNLRDGVTDPPAWANVITNNIVFDIEGRGIESYGLPNVIISNNLIVNCSGDAVVMTEAPNFVNNTIANSGGSGVIIDNWTAGEDEPDFINNLIYNWGSGEDDYGIRRLNWTGTAEYCDIYDEENDDRYNAGTNLSNCLNVDPEIVIEYDDVANPEDMDYHLNWDSPCLHAGDPDIDNPVINNHSHGDSDIGAYGGPGADPYYVAIAGDIEGPDAEFVELDSPYRVVAISKILGGEELEIYPSTSRDIILEFLEDVEFSVLGTLTVDGSNGYKTIFRAYDSENRWYGIDLEANSEASIKDAEIRDADQGIWVHNADLNLEVSRIHHCEYGFRASSVSSTDGLVDCDIDNNDYGLLFLSSTFTNFKKNDIYDNSLGGMYLGSSDQTIGVSESYYGNRFEDNGQEAATDAYHAELVFLNCDPFIKKCHNDFVENDDIDGEPILITAIGSAAPTNDIICAGNFYGSEGDGDDWFIPNNWFNYNPNEYDLTANRNALSTDDFTLAQNYELNGYYESAATLYLDLAEDDGITAAFMGWLRCRDALGITDSVLVEDCESYLEDEDLGSSAFWARLTFQNRIGDFEESIDQLDDYIMDADTEEDSLYGILHELETYYQMAMDEGGELDGYGGSRIIDHSTPLNLPVLGMNAEVVPYSIKDFHQKQKEVLQRMFGETGETTFTGSEIPSEYELHSAYPNPFNPTTQISFTLVKTQHVRLTVYNTLGQQVADLVDKRMTPGIHEVTFNASNLASGMYFYWIETPEFADMKKMVLIK